MEGVLGDMVRNIELHGGTVELYDGVFDYMWVLSYIIIDGSIGLHDVSVELYGGECWVTWWGLLGYMVECWVTWWDVWLHGRVMGYIVVGSIMGIVGLHGGESWVT